MDHPILGRRLLILTAHPDDEAFFVSGTAWKNHQSNGRTAIICATLGEKGMAHLKKPITRARLKVLRRRELMNSAKLSFLKPVFILRLPDGAVQERHWSFLKQARVITKKFRPDAIVTFGRDGITGHRDHIACWHVGRQLAKQFGTDLFVFTLAPQIAKQAPRWFMASRYNPHYRQIAAYKWPSVRIPIPPAFKNKILRQYPTQINPKNLYGMPKSAVKYLLGAEYFTQVKV